MGRALKCFSGSTIFLSCVNYAKTTGETIKLIWSFFFFFLKHQVTDSSLQNIKLEGSWDHLTITWHFQSFQEIGLRAGRPLRRGHVLLTGILAHCCQSAPVSFWASFLGQRIKQLIPEMSKYCFLPQIGQVFFLTLKFGETVWKSEFKVEVE